MNRNPGILYMTYHNLGNMRIFLPALLPVDSADMEKSPGLHNVRHVDVEKCWLWPTWGTDNANARNARLQWPSWRGTDDVAKWRWQPKEQIKET
jgi:hypothetical protein